MRKRAIERGYCTQNVQVHMDNVHGSRVRIRRRKLMEFDVRLDTEWCACSVLHASNSSWTAGTCMILHMCVFYARYVQSFSYRYVRPSQFSHCVRAWWHRYSSFCKTLCVCFRVSFSLTRHQEFVVELWVAPYVPVVSQRFRIKAAYAVWRGLIDDGSNHTPKCGIASPTGWRLGDRFFSATHLLFYTLCLGFTDVSLAA